MLSWYEVSRIQFSLLVFSFHPSYSRITLALTGDTLRLPITDAIFLSNADHHHAMNVRHSL